MRLRERGDSIILCKFCEKADSPWWLPLVNMIAQRDAKEKGGTWNFRTDETCARVKSSRWALRPAQSLDFLSSPKSQRDAGGPAAAHVLTPQPYS